MPHPVIDVQAKRQSLERFKAAVTDADPNNAKILNLIVDLGNTVLSKRAAADLQGYVFVFHIGQSLV